MKRLRKQHTAALKLRESKQSLIHLPSEFTPLIDKIAGNRMRAKIHTPLVLKFVSGSLAVEAAEEYITFMYLYEVAFF